VRSEREIELTEGALVVLVVAVLTTLGLTLWLGARLQGGARLDEPDPSQLQGRVASVDRARSPLSLPPGFLGPPPPADPPPIGGAPGRGPDSSLPWVALELERSATERSAQRRTQELLARGLPAYVEAMGRGRFAVRVGDYATASEAETVRAALARAGLGAQVIRGTAPAWLETAPE